MLTPRPASDVDLAFPATVIGTFLPRPEWIGDRSQWLSSPWGRLTDGIFAGRPDDLGCTFEHDHELVWRHIRVCLGSFEPSHQDKIAGIAFLLAVWMNVEWPAERQQEANALQEQARERAEGLTWEPIR